MLFLENIKLAVNAIRVNKMRSFLTMLGIIIGISSVIAISSIGTSAQGAVSKEFDSIGAGYMYIMPDWNMLEEITEQMMFSDEDLEAFRQKFSNELKYTALYVFTQEKATVGRVEADLAILGVAANYHLYSTNIQIIHGRMINQRDLDHGTNSIVIPVDAARKLFGKDDVVGKTISSSLMGRSVDFMVVGVYETPASIFSAMDTSSSYSCYMPYNTLAGEYNYSSYIEIYADDSKDLSEQAMAFTNFLDKYKGVEPGTYTYQSAEDQLGMINNVLGYLSVAIGAIAAISLLVGGIGIMNIMLVSVTERTREIGIRKSLGARTSDILTQFLIEAMILSVIGGILGTALGIGIASIGTSLAGVDTMVNPTVIVLSVCFSAAVGLFFGLFPARKAAKLDPIEALRYE